MEEFTFFWKGPLSQWWKSDFTHDGITYNCAEQWMMYQKAKLFKDKKAMADVLATKNPREQQAIGRRVANFNQRDWDANARTIVTMGNIHKFGQDEKLLKILLDTIGTELVEASPMDKVWGIKMAEDHPDVRDRTKWRGTNWLGECLMIVRDKFYV